MESLGHVHHAPARPQVQLKASIEFKQTLIPVFLTLFVCASVTASLHWVLPNSFFADMPKWYSITLFCFGAPMLVFGIFTMIQVRQQLMTQGSKS